MAEAIVSNTCSILSDTRSHRKTFTVAGHTPRLNRHGEPSLAAARHLDSATLWGRETTDERYLPLSPS